MADVVKMTQEQEDKLIDDAYQTLFQGYLNSNHRKKVEKIKDAYEFAREAHKGVRRRNLCFNIHTYCRTFCFCRAWHC